MVLCCVQLDKAIKAPGSNYDFVTRLLLTRCEVDLESILAKYGKHKFKAWMDKEFKKSNKLVHHIYSKLIGQ